MLNLSRVDAPGVDLAVFLESRGQAVTNIDGESESEYQEVLESENAQGDVL